jgi:hypothetical protein
MKMKEIMESWRKTMTLLNEGGFARVQRILLGMVPSIDTAGILTGWNPDGQEIPRNANNRLNKVLFQDLKTMGYGPIKIKGSFGNFERSFLVPNMSRADVVELGLKYGQEAVIWGQKMGDDDDPKMVFDYIEGDKTVQQRNVALVGIQPGDPPEDVQSREDYYSEKAGRKFIIPFFDDNYEFEVEGSLDEVLFKDQVIDTPESRALLKKIEVSRLALKEENRTKKSYWHHRCVLREYTRKLRLISKKGVDN